MPRPGLLIYFDLLPALDTLSAEDAGQLLIAALHYAKDGVSPSFPNSSLTFAWEFIRPSIDRDGSTYQEKMNRGEWLTYCRECKRDGVEPLSFVDWRQQRDNGTLQHVTKPLPTTTSTQLQTNTTTESNYILGADKPPTRSTFSPPSVEEVKAYCDERNNGIDPQRFVDYYAARNWMSGKTRIKDWRAAVRTWERREKDGKVAAPKLDEGRWGDIKSVQLD